MQEQKQQKRGNGSHGNGQKKRLEKLKKCRITIHVLQLNKEKAETSILC